MTVRSNAAIATIALAIMAFLAFPPATPWAEESVAAAGAGDNAEPGDAAPGADKDAPAKADDDAAAAPPDDEETGKEAKKEKDEPEPEADVSGAKAAESDAEEEKAPAKDDEKDAAPPEKAETDEPASDDAKDDEAPGKSEAAEDDSDPTDDAGADKKTQKASAAKEVSKSGLRLPKDPVARAAFLSLEKNCARCHQVGPLLKKSKPERGFGNVLDLDGLVEDSAFVIPGVPDGSKLFSMITDKLMPYDCYQAFECEGPSEEQVTAIRDWIVAVGNPECTDREPIDEAAVVGAIADDLSEQQESRRKGMRYVTLANLYNTCASNKDLKLYRQAVVKLLNSLSRNSDVLELRTVDPAKTIVAFHLDDLEWTEADWDRLISVYPYAMRPDTADYDAVKGLTETPLAWVRGDWFAYSASRPPLYYDLLKLPKTFAELEKLEDVDIKVSIDRGKAKRAGFRHSGVSAHNRLIERHTIPTGYFWTSYDFKGDAPEQTLFLHPLGPDGPNAFRHDGGETIFSLPNGFQGYYLNTAPGERIDSGPIEIVRDDSQRDRLVTNGISCFGCHKIGLNRTPDEIRHHVENDLSFDEETREKVLDLYPSKDEMNALLDKDAKRYRDALERAGLSLSVDIDGPYESINALSRRYERDLLPYVAAAEFGLDREVFKERLNDVGDKFVAIKRRLAVGQLPRLLFEKSFKGMLTRVSAENRPLDLGPPQTDIAQVADTTEITLVADKAAYKVNDLPTFTVTPNKDCHLTVINVDASGEGVVIFPNKFEPNNFVSKGTSLQIPPKDAEWQFRLKDPGTEEVIAVCNASGKDVEGIKHNFQKEAFTSTGDRRGVARRVTLEAKEKIAEGKKAKEEGDVEKAEAIAKGDDLIRTAIKVEVQ